MNLVEDFLAKPENVQYWKSILDNYKDAQKQFFRRILYLVIILTLFLGLKSGEVELVIVNGVGLKDLQNLLWIFPLIFAFQQYNSLVAFQQFLTYEKTMERVLTKVVGHSQVLDLLLALRSPTILSFESQRLNEPKNGWFHRMFAFLLLLSLLVLPFFAFITFIQFAVKVCAEPASYFWLVVLLWAGALVLGIRSFVLMVNIWRDYFRSENAIPELVQKGDDVNAQTQHDQQES